MANPAVKSQPRLISRRLIVVDVDAERARALARALQISGATVIAVSTADADHQAAHGLDAEVMLVNADEADACRPVVAELRSHPRTRWTTVVPLSFEELWPDRAEPPDLVAIANAVGTLAVSAVELAVRTKGRLPYDTVLEPLGPSRTLRALGNTGRKLRVVLSDGRMRAELELEDGKIGGVRARFAGAEPTLCNAHALVEVLALSTAEVRVEERTTATLSDWNVSLTTALATAAALGQTRWARSGTRPVIATPEPERAEAEAHTSVANGTRGGQAAPQRIMQPTVPQISLAEALAIGVDAAPSAHAPEGEPARRRSQQPTAQISLADALAEADVVRASDPQGAPVAEPSSEPRAHDDDAPPAIAPAPAPAPAPARRRVVGTLTAAAVASAVALASAALFVRFGRAPEERAQSSLTAIQQAGALEPARAQPHPPAASKAQPAAETAAETDVALVRAQVDPAPQPVAAAPTRQELERAERLVKSASRRQRARRHAEATAGYLQALELAPDHSAAVLGLVRVQLQLKNGPEALRWARRLSALQPERRTSLLLLGDAHALNGDHTEAEQAWRQASQLGSTTARRRLQR